MGRRGPPPKPTILKDFAGTLRKGRMNPAEPRPTVAAPPCPAWLPKRAKAEWKRIVPELLALGLLSRIDQAALANYCLAVHEVEAATQTLELEGRVCTWPVTDKHGEKIGEKLKAHPCVQMQRDAARLVKVFLTEFGLTPASRTRVHGAPPDAGTGDAREGRFFNVG